MQKSSPKDIIKKVSYLRKRQNTQETEE